MASKAVELVEKIARAQAGARWEKFDDEHKDAARDLARIAIDAITESGVPCGVCGCLVFPGLPNTLMPVYGSTPVEE